MRLTVILLDVEGSNRLNLRLWGVHIHLTRYEHSCLHGEI